MTNSSEQADKSLIEYQCEETMRTAINLFRSYCERTQDRFPMVLMSENGICCIVFKGDHIDQELMEEYLRTRLFEEDYHNGMDTRSNDCGN